MLASRVKPGIDCFKLVLLLEERVRVRGRVHPHASIMVGWRAIDARALQTRVGVFVHYPQIADCSGACTTNVLEPVGVWVCGHLVWFDRARGPSGAHICHICR